MSAVTPSTPYVAPWSATFTRYSVQQLPFVRSGSPAQHADLVVPDGQWYRMITCGARVDTGGTTGNRQVVYSVVALDGTTDLEFATTPAQVVASGSCIARFAPNFQFVSVAGAAGQVWGYAPSVDVLYGPGITYRLAILNSLTNDNLTAPIGLVEIYVETPQGTLEPIVAPALT